MLEVLRNRGKIRAHGPDLRDFPLLQHTHCRGRRLVSQESEAAPVASVAVSPDASRTRAFVSRDI
jgi:hypothetical protein